MKFKTSFTLILLASLLAAVFSLVRVPSAHAQTTFQISDCGGDAQLQVDVGQANKDNAGDKIIFDCGATFFLSNTLTISGSMTLDGNGHSVTLDGNNQMQVLSVNSGVTFNLNALTIAHGLGAGIVGGFCCSGGGLYNNGGTVNISNSTFSGNSATFGGGLENNGGTVNISNSTFSGNSATFGGGGLDSAEAGTVSIANSTFSNNTASSGGGGIKNEGFGSTVSIGGSIVADNTGGSCSGGGISDQGYNLESGTDCGFTGTGSLQNTDPKLDPNGLQNNGGPTQTIALQATSPAIDHIPTSACVDSQGHPLTTDQRGMTRLPGERCDIGAFEFPDTTAPTLQLPSPISTNATSPAGATVTYSATATDDDGDSLVATCAPASGSTFPIGTTTVNCSASEPGSNTASGNFQVVVNDTDLGLTNISANITTNATSPQGAIVTYPSPTVVDEDSPGPSVSCTPASGSTFPIGTTTVTCTATDSDDTPSTVSGSFQVVVKDVTPPVLSLPGTLTVDATSPQGAVVPYTVTATDPDNPPSQLTISCSPASGSTFPIGTTTVNCQASDPAGNMASGSFTVTVEGAAQQVNDLINLVNSMGLSSSLQTALDNKLQDVLTAINAGQTATACSELTDFIGFVQSHIGKGISSSQAKTLIQAAEQIQAVLGC